MNRVGVNEYRHAHREKLRREETMSYANTSDDTYFRDEQTLVYEHPLREGSEGESTSSLSPGGALVLTLLYSAGLWAGMWLSVTGLFW